MEGCLKGDDCAGHFDDCHFDDMGPFYSKVSLA